jgi:hypothetical protein
MVEFIQQGTKITSEVYCETLKKLHRAGHSEQKAWIAANWSSVLLHPAARTQALLEHFSRELFDHPSYSPDLTPNDYHLFTYLKNWLRSQRFSDNEELMEGVKMWLTSQAADFFMHAFFVYNKFFFPHCLLC